MGNRDRTSPRITGRHSADLRASLHVGALSRLVMDRRAVRFLGVSRDLLAAPASKSWTTGVISYHMGNWAPPLGIEYRIDFVNAFVLSDRICHRRCSYAIRSRERSR